MARQLRITSYHSTASNIKDRDQNKLEEKKLSTEKILLKKLQKKIINIFSELRKYIAILKQEKDIIKWNILGTKRSLRNE